MSYEALKSMGSVHDGEVVVKLADGWFIHSGVYKRPADSTEDVPTSGEYIRLVDPEGVEYLYYDQAEWEREGEGALVIGAFINVAAGLRGLKEKVWCKDRECDCDPMIGGYHYE